MRTPDPDKQEAKRRHIMDAAIRCFGKNGFHGTSTNQICAEAGMSPGNLFHYFPSKQALIAAIIESEHVAYAARFAELRAEPDAFVALEKIARAVLEQCSNPLHARLWLEIAAESAANEEIGQTMAAHIATYQKDLAALVRRGQAAGQIAADLKPKDVAMWLLAMSDGFAVQMLGRSSDSLAKHTEVLVPLVRRLLMPQAQSRSAAACVPRKTAASKTSSGKTSATKINAQKTLLHEMAVRTVTTREVAARTAAKASSTSRASSRLRAADEHSSASPSGRQVGKAQGASPAPRARSAPRLSEAGRVATKQAKRPQTIQPKRRASAVRSAS